MPAGGIHLCVAKKVARKLKVENMMSFYVGNVAPDSWRNSASTKEGTHFITTFESLDYDYERFWCKYRNIIEDDFVLGYLVHLIVDKYWYSNNLPTTHVPASGYEDLNRLCSKLIEKYGIPRLELEKNFFNPIEELETVGIAKTLNFLNEVDYLENKENSFDIEKLTKAIDETSLFVEREIERLKSSCLE